MQHSVLSAFNPVKLVESLKLRATEQQDAQEYVACNARCLSSIIQSLFSQILEAVYGTSGYRVQEATEPRTQVLNS